MGGGAGGRDAPVPLAIAPVAAVSAAVLGALVNAAAVGLKATRRVKLSMKKDEDMAMNFPSINGRGQWAE